MGLALGLRLGAAGHTIVTTDAGRSARTATRCRAAGFAAAASLDELVRRSDVLLSCVPPAQALDVARAVAAAGVATGRRLYVDLNSISPQTAIQVAAIVDSPAWEFADAAI